MKRTTEHGPTVNGRLGHVLETIRKQVALQHTNTLPDHELLDAFVRRKDAAAFGAILHRHGSMVLSVCRRVLQNAHDAEDACQAAFLILAQRAAKIRKRDSLASWLHGVAYRVAKKLQTDLARRRTRSAPFREVSQADTTTEVSWREVQVIIDEELERLPDHYRAPLVLCYLEGKTQDEAARQLGWTLGTLRGRLDRGREHLRTRLVRRGVTLSAALLSTALTQTGASAAMPATLTVSTVHAATALAAGKATAAVSGQVVALVEGVLKAMFMTKISVATLIVSGIFVVAVAGTLGFRAIAADQPAPQTAKAQETPNEPPKATRKPADEKKQLSKLLKDEDAAVRKAAIVALKKIDEEETIPYIRQHTHRVSCTAFFRELHSNLLGAPPNAGEAQQFSKGTGKQRVAAINKLLSRAAREKKWDEKKRAQVRETIFEMLLSLDQDVLAQPLDKKNKGASPSGGALPKVRGGAQKPTIVDFDHDGWPDIIVSGDAAARKPAMVDVNQDGWPDLIVSGQGCKDLDSDAGVDILFNADQPAAPGAKAKADITVVVKNVLLTAVDTKRNTISVRIAGMTDKGVWPNRQKLYLGIDGKIVGLPAQSARLEGLPLAKTAKITINGKQAAVADLKVPSFITFSLIITDGEKLEVGEINAVRLIPIKSVPLLKKVGVVEFIPVPLDRIDFIPLRSIDVIPLDRPGGTIS